MSLPSIKELIVNFKDLGNYAQNVKGVFPLVLNEKAAFSFEQKWMETLNFESAYFHDLEKKGLLEYNEFEGKKPSIDEINEMTNETPTELGEGTANTFRKGIEGVFRILQKNEPTVSKAIESYGYDHKELVTLDDQLFVKMQMIEPAFEKQWFNAFSKSEMLGDVVAVLNPPIHNPQPAPFGHRLHNPQHVILPDDDIDVGRFFGLFDEIDNDTLKALLNADLELLGVPEPVDTGKVDEALIKEVFEDFELPEIDGAAINAFVEEFFTDLSLQDAISALTEVIGQEEITDVPSILQPREEVLTTENIVPQATVANNPVLNASAPVPFDRFDNPQPITLEDSDINEGCFETAPLLPSSDSETIDTGNKVNDALIEEMLKDFELLSQIEEVVLAESAVTEVPSQLLPCEEMATTVGLVSPVVEELALPSSSSAVSQDDDALIDTIPVNDSPLIEKVDDAAVDALLNRVSDETPKLAPAAPPPPPLKSMAEWAAEKVKATKVLSVETAESSTLTESVKPKKIHADMPAFKITPNEFVTQLQKMREKAADKTTVEIVQKKHISDMGGILLAAIEARGNSFQKDTTTSLLSSTDEWEQEERCENNKKLIVEQAKEVARSFDIQTKVNQLLETNAQTLTDLVDSYEQKVKALRIISKLDVVAQENSVLVDGVTEAVNNMQRILIADVKAYTTSATIKVMEDFIVDKMDAQFDVEKSTTEIDQVALQKAIADLLTLQPVDLTLAMDMAADRAIEEVLTAERDYFDHGAIPTTGFCKLAVEHVTDDLENAKGKFVKIIEEQSLADTTAGAASKPVEADSFMSLFTNALFRRRKDSGYDDDLEDSTDDFDSEESHDVNKDVDAGKTVASDKPIEVSESANPFSFDALKNIIGKAFGVVKPADTTEQSKPVEGVDIAAVDELLLSMSLTTASEEVNHDAVNELLGVMSPMSSEYFTPDSSGYFTPIGSSDVLVSDTIPGVDSGINAAVTPMVIQQMLTETHDHANGSAFGC